MMAAPDRCAVPEPPPLSPAPGQPAAGRPVPPQDRAALRLRSLSWAGLSAASAALVALLLSPLAIGPPPLSAGGVDMLLRSAACGFFLGLLAFHLQRVDPDDSHLQAGLVGAVCGIRSLGAGTGLPPLPEPEGAAGLLRLAPSLMMDTAVGWLPLWLPVIGSAVVLHGLRRRLPSPHPPPHLSPTLPCGATTGSATGLSAGATPEPQAAPPSALRP